MADFDIALRGAVTFNEVFGVTTVTSASAQTNDYLVVTASVDFRPSSVPAISATTGVTTWQEIASAQHSNLGIRAWLGRATTSGTKSITVTQGGGTSGLHVQCFVLDPGNGGEITVDGLSSMTDTTSPYTHTSISPSGTRDWLFCAHGMVQFAGTAAYGSAPSGMTSVTRHINEWSGLQTCYQALSSSGSTGTRNQTSTPTSLSSGGGAGFMFALRSQGESDVPVDAGTDPLTVTDTASAEVTVTAGDALEFTEDVAVGIPIERADSLEVDEEAHADAETVPGDTAGVSETTSFDADLAVADELAVTDDSGVDADLDAGTDELTVDDDTWITNLADDELAVTENTRFRADLRVGDAWQLAEGAAVESLYADLAISFYGVDPDDGHLVPLPDFTKLSISPQRNGPGAISLDYPVGGLNFEWLYQRTVARDADLEVEIWNFGSTVGALRGYLQEASGDAVEESKTWTYAGRTLELRMAEGLVEPAPLVGELDLGENVTVIRSTVTLTQWNRLLGLGYRPNNDADPRLSVPQKIVDAVRANATSIPVLADPRRELKFTAATPGEIVGTLLAQARRRGTLVDITTDATDTHDSDGNAWPTLITTKYSPHTGYDSILDKLTGDGRIEWALVWTGSARVLKLWVAGKRGVDRTVGLQPVVLRAGRNLIESPHKWSVKDSVTRMFAAGSQGVYSTSANPDAATRRYRQIEGATSSSALDTTDAVTAFAQRQLSLAVDGTLEIDHSLGFLPGEPRPLVAFDIGDWVYSQTGTEFDRYRVVQWSLTVDANRNQSGIVVLNDAHTDSAVRQRQQLNALASGDTVVGTSTPPSDTGVPEAPEGLVVGSDAFTASNGTTQSAVTVGWAAVTMNTDATAVTDLDGYRVAWRPNNVPGWRVAGDTDSLSLSFTTDPAESIWVRVQALDRNGNRSEWSNEVNHVTDDDDTPPGVPSTPTVADYLGTLSIAWDGRTDSGADMTASYRDFWRVEVHVSTASNFTPSAATLVGELRAGGRYVVTDLPYGVTQFVRLVAVDRRYNASAPSAQGSAVPNRVVNLDLGEDAVERAHIRNAAIGSAEIDLLAVNDAHIGSLSAGKITAGVMSAAMTVSGIIRTATTGARVELDGTGFWCVNSANESVLSYSIADENMQMTGRLDTLGEGDAAISIIPMSQPTMYLWSINGAFGPAYLNAVDAGSGQTALGINSGPSIQNSGSTSSRQSRVWLRPDVASFEMVNGQQSNRGGQVVVQDAPGGVTLSYFNSAGTWRSYVRIDESGVLLDNPGGGGWVHAKRDGYVFVNNHQLCEPPGPNSRAGWKTFVIDHPDDPDRWLVHGCTESPTAGIEYWGEAEIRDGHAVVELPSYFESLTLPENRQVQLTPIGAPSLCAATRPRDGRFFITSDAPDGHRVAWLVKASRGTFDPEPRRSDIDVHGDGPYRYFTPTQKEDQ